MAVANKQFLQDAFEFAVRGVMAQKGLATKSSSISGWSLCEYKTLEGNKCAFGQFILDHLYDRILEGRGPSELIDLNHKRNFLDARFNYYDREFYKDLQKTHDTTLLDTGSYQRDALHIKKEMISRYREMAAKYELNTDFLDNIYIYEERNNSIRISKD